MLTNCIASDFHEVNTLCQRTTLLQRSLVSHKFTCLQGDGSLHQLCCGTSASPLWIIYSEEETLAPQKQATALQSSHLRTGFCPKGMAGGTEHDEHQTSQSTCLLKGVSNTAVYHKVRQGTAMVQPHHKTFHEGRQKMPKYISRWSRGNG